MWTQVSRCLRRMVSASLVTTPMFSKQLSQMYSHARVHREHAMSLPHQSGTTGGGQGICVSHATARLGEKKAYDAECLEDVLLAQLGSVSRRSLQTDWSLLRFGTLMFSERMGNIDNTLRFSSTNVPKGFLETCGESGITTNPKWPKTDVLGMLHVGKFGYLCEHMEPTFLKIGHLRKKVFWSLTN